jgi:hypothetical protein
LVEKCHKLEAIFVGDVNLCIQQKRATLTDEESQQYVKKSIEAKKNVFQSGWGYLQSMLMNSLKLQTLGCYLSARIVIPGFGGDLPQGKMQNKYLS